jgi:purine-binding chemotaxis protein CheW
MAEDGARRVLVCRVGSERVALPVSAVRQVVASVPVTRIPGAPEAVRGIANVHGILVTTVSVPRLLGLPVPEQSGWLVVLSMCQGRVGIEVDEVEDVHDGGGEALPMLDLDALIRPLISQEAVAPSQ